MFPTYLRFSHPNLTPSSSTSDERPHPKIWLPSIPWFSLTAEAPIPWHWDLWSAQAEQQTTGRESTSWDATEVQTMNFSTAAQWRITLFFFFSKFDSSPSYDYVWLARISCSISFCPPLCRDDLFWLVCRRCEAESIIPAVKKSALFPNTFTDTHSPNP